MQESVAKPKTSKTHAVFKQHDNNESFNYPMDAKKPAIAIAILPANDLFLL